jgi:hypothetical protein
VYISYEQEVVRIHNVVLNYNVYFQKKWDVMKDFFKKIKFV